MRKEYVITNTPGALRFDTSTCRDFIQVQVAWQEFKRRVKQLASTQFWHFFLRMHSLSGVAIETALTTAKNVFIPPRSPAWRQFPPSRRALIRKISKVPAFWYKVLHTVAIDVSEFELPSGTKSIQFCFIDPIWGWLVAARRQNPLDLHWKPVQQGRDPVYGGGVQFGQCFAQSVRSCPARTHIMGISLHWDGTSTHSGIASTPICIGVANCNNCDLSTQFCLAYVPKLPDDSPEFRKLPIATQAKFSIRQQCIGAILNVLESAAATGVLCRLPNQHGLEVDRVLFPRLFAMNLDQPEAQLFFGMLNRTSCSKCKWRKGYSAFRSCTAQNRDAVSRLYYMVQELRGEHALAVKEKLRRWGFNPNRRCCMLTGYDNLLVKLPDREEVFPCVDYRDRMHGLVIFIHRVITESLEKLSKQVLSGPNRRILDRRLKYICKGRFLREPLTGRPYRAQESIFSDVGMTATDKQCSIFLLPHVLGVHADLLPGRVHAALLTTVSYAQLLLIAVSGLRAYNKRELEIIFNRGYKVLFGALQNLLQIDHDTRVQRHEQHPEHYPAVPDPKIQSRTWASHRTNNTDTSSTSDDSTLVGLDKFAHGNHGLTHQHWVDQVVSAGSFAVHCTQAAESHHKHCMKLPSQRVRHLTAARTQTGMQEYLKYTYLFSEMEQELPSFAPPRQRTPSSGMSFELSIKVDGQWKPLSMGSDFAQVEVQQSFLHPELRIARFELLDLLCDYLHLPKNLNSYRSLQNLDYAFGQKWTRSDGAVFWATDTQYNWTGTSGNGKRRDNLFIKGVETTRTRQQDGRYAMVQNALCCEAVGFLVVNNLAGCLSADTMTAFDGNDSLDLVIARWFRPHPRAYLRDKESRPICPGELYINHCLWEYASTPTCRRALVRRDGSLSTSVRRQPHIFGRTDAERIRCVDQEKRAYYCLLSPQNIISRSHMSPVFQAGTSTPDNNTWLQTVTLI